MPNRPISPSQAALSRREFVKTAAVTAALAGGFRPVWGYAAGADTIRVGVIGCGGRGTGAAINALEAAPNTKIVALADVLPDRLASSRGYLAGLEDPAFAGRAKVADDRCYSGFDAYKQLLAGEVDLVILATPPHFRPVHLAAAVERGCHVFMEKPVAVDPVGIRSVIASGEAAAAKGLAIVAGTQRRHEKSYLEAMQRIRDGAIGRIVAARCSWNQGGLWMHPRKPEWSDMEWQLRNWLYFAWLSGDHIVEQHVHNLDAVNWAIGAHPVKALALGGRQVRTDPAYGHVFDHFAVEYEYPDGVLVSSQCRQIDGCASRVDESFFGTNGRALTRPGYAQLSGMGAWTFAEPEPNPYVQEHADLIASIVSGAPLNEARTVAESTLTAIMGRMSAYTGQEVTWEQAMNSPLDLSPPAYEFGPLSAPEVAIPGRTPLVLAEPKIAKPEGAQHDAP